VLTLRLTPRIRAVHFSRRVRIKRPTARPRITIRLDDDVLDWFRKQVDDAGGGSYQNLINQALRAYIERSQEPLEAILRRGVREEQRWAS
jgi:uncharacterized protein (DUF4415 family)